MSTQPITKQQVLDNATKALNNLIEMLPETIEYHPDTQMRVEKHSYAEGIMRIVFTAEIIVIEPTESEPHP